MRKILLKNLQTDKNLPFAKGNGPTFSFSERKSCKKKQTSLLLDLLSVQYCKVRSSLYSHACVRVKAYLKVHILLDERSFAARRSFEFL